MESNKYPIRKSVFNANGTLSHSMLRKGNGTLKGRVGDGSVSDAVTPVPGTEESGEDGPRDGMPCTRDGTGSAASGSKKRPASTVARPAFCMPTSMEIVRFRAVLKWNRRPARYPVRYPNVL